MLLLQRMQNTKMPSAEKNCADFLCREKNQLKGLSTRQIASLSYVTPSTLVRLAKRLGYVGWNDFFEDFLNEVDYLERNFKEIDANRPFLKDDNFLTIANKLGTLCKESIDDTLSLLDWRQLEKAVKLLKKSNMIYIVAVSVSLDCTFLFKHKMQRIGKTVMIESTHGEQLYPLFSATPKDCAIVVSYSGTTLQIVEEVTALHSNRVPIILLTGLGANTVRPMADCIFNITTHEKLHSKISSFSTEESIQFLLDVLFACYFSTDYDHHWDTKMSIAQKVEHNRESTNLIMQEFR